MSQRTDDSGSGDGPGEAAREPKRPEPDRRPTKPAGRPADVAEVGGPKGPEPTRYGDWEKGGRCTDF